MASSLFIVGLLTTMAAGIYPYILPAHDGSPNGLTIDEAAAGSHALKTALIWWPIGMALAAVYFVFAYRMFFAAPTDIEAAEPGMSGG
jgi:cytochrome d ubiquinol oxidase subunit II